MKQSNVIRMTEAALTPARSALQDHLAATAAASVAAQRAAEPVARLEHWQREATEAEQALREFDSTFQAELTTWASHGAGTGPQMDAKKRESLAVRVAVATAKRNAAEMAARSFQEAQAAAAARLRELNAELPALVADTLLEEAAQISEKHNRLMVEAVGMRAQLQALGDLMCSNSMNESNNYHGLRTAESLRNLVFLEPPISSEQRDRARTRVATFANTVSADPSATF